VLDDVDALGVSDRPVREREHRLVIEVSDDIHAGQRHRIGVHPAGADVTAAAQVQPHPRRRAAVRRQRRRGHRYVVP
jgi:hypothetical protein